MLPRENLKFLNVRNTGFGYSGGLFASLQMPSMQNLKKCLCDPSFTPKISPESPFKATFFS